MDAFWSGAAAGIAVDSALFPVDSLKTRLQSEVGFIKAGAFRNLYAGIGPVALGSGPSAALFFTAYEGTRALFNEYAGPEYRMLGDMTAASVGEVTACVVRVPVEVIKQRVQVTAGEQSSSHVLSKCIREEGFRGLFRGYRSTVIREIPFAFIQFPIWEQMKRYVAKSRGKEETNAVESALCGFFAGGFSAGVTTPLDVAKTRIMLADRTDSAASGRITHVIRDIYRKEGLSALFSGVVPRVTMISVGGFIFLGAYDATKHVIRKIFGSSSSEL